MLPKKMAATGLLLKPDVVKEKQNYPRTLFAKAAFSHIPETA